MYGGRNQSRTGLDGFAIHCITALLSGQKEKKPNHRAFKTWSGKRDSNSRHSRWQRDALPAELFPQIR